MTTEERVRELRFSPANLHPVFWEKYGRESRICNGCECIHGDGRHRRPGGCVNCVVALALGEPYQIRRHGPILYGGGACDRRDGRVYSDALLDVPREALLEIALMILLNPWADQEVEDDDDEQD